MKKLAIKKRYSVPFLICLIMVLLNVIARASRGFSDFYAEKIFHWITEIFSRISGLFPFSAGEMLIILGLLLVLIGVPAFILLMIFGRKFRKKTLGISSLILLYVFTFILTTETLNCFLMYQCTPMADKFLGGSRGHTRTELTELYSMLIADANELALQVPRDENNRFYLTADVNEEAKKAMKKAAGKFPQLRGYYPDAKPIQFSYFMSQSHLSGIYFPFSLESNYNDDMCRTNLPTTICHEYSHLKGFIQEDEANFIAYYAARECSSNVEFQYAGCLDALEYVHNQIYEKNISSAFYLTENISDEVRRDWFRFLPDNYWEENKKKEIIPTEKVDSVSTKALETNIKMNGREEGIETYSLVVELLLDHYFAA